MTWFFSPLKPCHYTVIYADPPTRFRTFTPFDSGKAPPYATMSDAWLRELPVENLAAADCLLWLWSTMPQLRFSFELLDTWGFRYVTAGAWFKRTVNGKLAFTGGQVMQNGAEVCLLGARGRPPYVKRPVKGAWESDVVYDHELACAWREMDAEAIDALRREHSRKPDEQYEAIETLMGAVPRCELFSRCDRPGWDHWGDEAGMFHGEQVGAKHG